jgi:hypothetical protein
MKKLLLGKILLVLALASSTPATAGVNIGINISLPPPIVFAAPPEVIVLPETYVYVVPDLDVDIFFYSGWWWRPWEGRWYRSRNYSSGWIYYRNVPTFYRGIPSGWRNDYRDHRWRGHQWDYQRLPHKQVQQNWRGWEKNKHWEKQNTWGVRDWKPQTRSQQPSKAVQPQSPTVKQRGREAARPQQSRPQPREVQPQQPRPQPQAKPEVRKPAKPQQSRPQSREVQPQQPRPQRREAQQQSQPRPGKPERGEHGKQDRK